MTNENPKNESLIDAIPFPEESILLDLKGRMWLGTE